MSSKCFHLLINKHLLKQALSLWPRGDISLPVPHATGSQEILRSQQNRFHLYFIFYTTAQDRRSYSHDFCKAQSISIASANIFKAKLISLKIVKGKCNIWGIYSLKWRQVKDWIESNGLGAKSPASRGRALSQASQQVRWFPKRQPGLGLVNTVPVCCASCDLPPVKRSLSWSRAEKVEVGVKSIRTAPPHCVIETRKPLGSAGQLPTQSPLQGASLPGPSIRLSREARKGPWGRSDEPHCWLAAVL